MSDADNSTVLDSWHMDKRVNISMIFAIAVQAVAVVWLAAKIDARVERVEQRTAALEAAQEVDRQWQGGVRADLGAIKARLDILIDRMQAEGRR